MIAHGKDIKVITGNSNPGLAKDICKELGYQDNLLDTGEVFGFWVIEGPQSIKDEFPFEKAGLPIIVVDDHTPYKQRKVRILNGAHTLKVVANDGKADSAPYTVTFTKKVISASITLAEPLDADDAITVMVLNIVGALPVDAVLQVLVTNNAKDAAPVWEDATADIKNGTNHVFENKTAANGFAFNFRVTAERGASGEGGYISSAQGGFQ